jgi:hypothetical protein
MPRVTASPDNRQVVSDALHPLIDEIRSLLEAPSSGADAPELDRLEETLTAGYAQALALEAETLRLERRLGEIATRIGRQGLPEMADELTSVAHRLAASESEVARLRAILSPLRDRAAAARAAAPVVS